MGVGCTSPQKSPELQHSERQLAQVQSPGVLPQLHPTAWSSVGKNWPLELALHVCLCGSLDLSEPVLPLLFLFKCQHLPWDTVKMEEARHPGPTVCVPFHHHKAFPHHCLKQGCSWEETCSLVRKHEANRKSSPDPNIPRIPAALEAWKPLPGTLGT